MIVNFINNPYHLAYINVFLIFVTSFLLFAYRYIFPKKKINFIFLLILISFIATWSIFRGGTYQSGDLRTHTVQLMSFYNNLTQGYLLPRWAGELCGGYGCPVLEFFYVLPYYIASVFHFIGFSFITSLKLLLAGSFIASGITMYLWVKEEFGKKAGLVGSIFYLFAPYHLIDLHFRAGIGEVLSFVFIPLVFLFCRLIFKKNDFKYYLLEGLSIALLLMSHSSTTTFILPLLIIYSLIIWFSNKKRKVHSYIKFILSIIVGLLAITFYWLPALVEVKYTWYSLWTVGDFRPILEYIYSPARFGLLFQGNNGEYRLIIGYFHLLAVILTLILLFIKKFKDNLYRLALFFLLSFILLFFMMTSFSIFIWLNIHFLNTFLMVWRLLIPIAFVTSILAAIVSTKINKDKILILICFLVISTTFLNWGNRKMVNPPANPYKIEVENYTEYVEPNNKKYKDNYINHGKIKTIIVKRTEAYSKHLEFISGTGKIIELNRKEEDHSYIIYSSSDSVLRENTYYFPGWTVYVDNKPTQVNYKNNNYGYITFTGNKGVHKIELKFEDTFIRKISRNISLITLFGLFLIILLRFKPPKHKLDKLRLF